MQNLTDIIIVKYGVPDLEAECVESVVKNTEVPHHLTVYDNLPGDENLSTVWNRLIERSNAEYICLLNNDTKVSKGWLGSLISGINLHEDAGAIGPITNQCGTHQSGFDGPQAHKIVPCRDLSGFCMLFRKSAWEAAGGFDESYKLYGEDSDFCRRLLAIGTKLYTHFGVWIYHYGHGSHEVAKKRGKDVEAIQKESAARFRQEWKK